jgi:pimeloyl-ACP methyl ester carboxylesterase
VSEAGFIELPPVEYTVRGGAASLATTTSAARLFFSFQPADADPETRPLVVMHNGGPGASTAILLGGNTGPMTLDESRTGDAAVAPNPTSWTAFASLLYVDARGTGFSYGLADGMEDEAARAAELSVRNFNSFVDAADLARAVLFFLRDHPALRAVPIVFAGESYGGLRSALALHLVFHPDRYGAGAETYEDPALAADIADHFAAAGTTAAAQFDHAILVQPRLSSPEQQAAAGSALEAPGSPLFAIAEETGVPFVPCSQKPAPCGAFANVLEYLTAAGRDLYDFRKPAGTTLARYAAIGERIEDPAVFPLATGVDPASIPEMSPAARDRAYRLVSASAEAEPFTARLGALAPYDRYFEAELFDLIGTPFAGPEALELGIERQNSRYGLVFLEDALDVRFFVTSAAADPVIWTPSLPEALEMYTTEVSDVHIEGEALTITYVPGAFGAAAAAERQVRLVPYAASGHSVSLDEPAKLAADVAAWLAE